MVTVYEIKYFQMKSNCIVTHEICKNKLTQKIFRILGLCKDYAILIGHLLTTINLKLSTKEAFTRTDLNLIAPNKFFYFSKIHSYFPRSKWIASNLFFYYRNKLVLWSDIMKSQKIDNWCNSPSFNFETHTVYLHGAKLH